MASTRHPLRAVSIASALALHALSATAQTTAAPPAPTLETIRVEASADASAEGLSKPFAGGQVARGSRIGVLGNQDMMDTPFNTTTYTRDLISNQQAQSIGDVLLNDASVRSARGFGNFQQAYFIRGFQVFSDDVAYNGLYGLVPRQYMATEFVERVEVFRGANAFLSGAGGGAVSGSGIGGLINVLPKRASNEALSEITVGAQTGGQGFAAVDLARRFGPDQSTGIRLNAVRRDGGTGIDNEKHELSALALGLDWRSRNVRLSADFGYQNDKQKSPRPSVTPASGLPIPDAPRADTNFAQPWTYSNSRDTFATARGEVDITDSITGWAALGARRSTEDNVLAPTSLDNTLGDFSGYRFDNARKDSVSTGEIGLRGKFVTGPVTHTATVSASQFESKSRNAYDFFGFGLVNDNIYTPRGSLEPTHFPAYSPGGGQLSNPLVTERIKNSSFAIADTMSFANDAVRVSLGARRQKIEDFTYDYDDGTPSSAYSKSRTTPVAGIVFKPTANVSIYANYIEGLVKGDTAGQLTSTGAALLNGGTVFAPSVSRQKEVGVKYDGGNFGASAAFFDIGKPNYGVTNQVFGRDGEQRNRGLELSGFGEPVRGLRLLAGVTLMDPEVRSPGNSTDGNNAIGVAKRQINVGAEWDVPGVSGLALNARVIHTGKQYADAANTQVVKAWTRLDIGARYLMDIGDNRTLILRARIDNLTNRSYWESVGGYPGSNYLVLAKPRTFAVSGTINF
ncbi:TonB-dependent receptor [Variovorax sp. PAMC 28711]|uniref:TonB-dependent receptor n=1 Tax=Variovorax sp. PAMC 28711 TaxID=1795631 RepID=UPI00078BEC50|nr:TonB-dependent receptor [Variovorax sp. PAMC 28711]AMM24993.1 TonB-dependent receptor [Variovorax sp. PAMC 28711]